MFRQNTCVIPRFREFRTVVCFSVGGLLSFHSSELGKTVRHRMIAESVFEISPKVSPGVSDYRREYW